MTAQDRPHLSSPIIWPESHLVVRRVPAGHRALVYVDGLLRLSPTPVTKPIIYPATLWMRVKAYGWRVTHSRVAAIRRAFTVHRQIPMPVYLVTIGVVFLGTLAAGKIMTFPTVESPSRMLSRSAITKAPPQHPSPVKTTSGAAPVTVMASAVAAAIPSASAVQPAQPASQIAPVKAASAIEPIAVAASGSLPKAPPTVVVLSPSSPASQALPLPMYPVPILTTRTFGPPPLPTSNSRKPSRAPVVPLPSAPIAPPFPSPPPEVAKTIDVDTVELRPSTQKIETAGPSQPSAEEAKQPQMTLAPDYRPVTTNGEALVIRLADGKFKEIQPGQKLPSGETLIGVESGGASYKTSVGTFKFSTNGVPKP